MDNVDIIQRSVDYIEENLKTNITAEELANNSGFSLFHYYRIFQSVVGMPVMQYVLRRRLINAIYEISINGKIIDVALSYGFDTHAGFFKAFRREFDCSPSQYLKKYITKKPYKINLKQEVCKMITHKKIIEVLANWGMDNETIGTFYYESSGGYASTAILSESFVQRDAEKLSKWVDIYKNIIYGYDSICKLTKEEKQALPYVVFSIQMICVAYFSDKDKYKELAEINKDMLKWLWDNKRNLVID